MKSVRVDAYAKINLGLRIVGRRADGYHDIETRFLQVSLADSLFFEANDTDEMELSCNWPEIPCDRSNLCSRAHQLLRSQVDCRMGIKLHIEKKIPTGAGLGGGSSDAAVTLITLNNLFNLDLDLQVLESLGQRIGSDVPFFFRGGFCEGRGRGEILAPIDKLPQFWVVLVSPNVSISTAWAYQNLKFGLTNEQKSSTFSVFKKEMPEVGNAKWWGENDFEGIVFDKYDELAKIKEELLKGGAFAANMTGSGSTIYGLFRSFELAQQNQQRFQFNYKSFLARPLKWGKKEVDDYVLQSVSGV